MSIPELLSQELVEFKERSDVIFPRLIRVGEDELVCTELLRLLPSKRMVCKATYQSETVLLKTFFGPSYKRRWARELTGVERIQQAGIKTPKVISSNCNDEQAIAYIIFEFIDDAKTLDVCLSRSNSTDERMAVFKKALVLIAQMHDVSIYQRDVHLGNFLENGRMLYLIDGDQIVKKGGKAGLEIEHVVNNLAMFFTQLFQWEKPHLEELLTSYVELRRQLFPDNFLLQVSKKLAEYINWRERKYIEKKVFRRCGAFDVIRNWHIFCVFSRGLDRRLVDKFIKAPDELIGQGDVLKSGRTAIVVRIELDGKTYVLKRYNKKSNIHQWFRSLMPSRSAVSWKNGHLLAFNHIPTAEPLLMLENRWGIFRTRSYILTKYIDGCHAFDYFETHSEAASRKKVAKKINKLVKHLHQCGFIHGDLKAHNIWVHGGEPLLIDLDGMMKAGDENKYAKDWNRLCRDLGDIDVSSQLVNGIEKMTGLRYF
ncbi:MAG: lipopolysaccharide kinase InaA family protein [Cycloclasticus sp.]|nr:lipopolysaccharide kinase InaA family protein [Cycloclasticus sp.]